jgi:hypothetical protein
MGDIYQETAFFERLTVHEVEAALKQVMPERTAEITPYMFDATVVIRHGPEEGPTLEDADRVAEILREGRPLAIDKADWHVAGIGPYCDALDINVVYGTSFGLVRAFLPTPEAVERVSALT